MLKFYGKVLKTSPRNHGAWRLFGLVSHVSWLPVFSKVTIPFIIRQNYSKETVDGLEIPTNKVEIGSFSHYLHGFFLTSQVVGLGISKVGTETPRTARNPGEVEQLMEVRDRGNMPTTMGLSSCFCVNSWRWLNFFSWNLEEDESFCCQGQRNHGMKPRDVRCFSKILVLIMMEIGTTWFDVELPSFGICHNSTWAQFHTS